MAAYKLTRAAEDDLEGIYYTGVVQFGLKQADLYFDGLTERFEQVAGTPLMYPDVSYIRNGYRRSVYGAHAIYYRVEDDIALIVRIVKHQDLKLP